MDSAARADTLQVETALLTRLAPEDERSAPALSGLTYARSTGIDDDSAGGCGECQAGRDRAVASEALNVRVGLAGNAPLVRPGEERAAGTVGAHAGEVLRVGRVDDGIAVRRPRGLRGDGGHG
jgi:hypothetical protein